MAGLFILLVYTLHKAFQRQRKHADWRPIRPRPGDATAFAAAAMQGVIARMKAREKELNDLLREAEQRGETSSRTLETIAREFPTGLMVFNREGFLALANPAVRTLLGIDTWSRRRYIEILGAESAIAGLLHECLENGRNCRDQGVDVSTPRGGTQTLSLSVSSWQGRSGQLEGIVCFVTKRK
jgi:PAS domain-containing protein